MPRKFRYTRIKNKEKKIAERLAESVPRIRREETVISSLEELHNSFSCPKDWSDQTRNGMPIKLCKISSTSSDHLVVIHSLVIKEDHTWTLHNHGCKFENTAVTPVSSIPSQLDCVSLQRLVNILDSANVCSGNNDPRFLEMADGQQCASGGRCDNPDVASCLHAAQSLRVQRSFAQQPFRGNCKRKRRLFSEQPKIDNTPVCKMPRCAKK